MRGLWVGLMLLCSMIGPGCLSPDGPEALDPSADDDGDGLPNGWEEERGLDPLNGSDGIVCHGMAEYCLRNYDNFTFPETHNSYATIEDGVWMAMNHYTALKAQWEGGIRAYMLDTHHLSKEDTDVEGRQVLPRRPGLDLLASLHLL
ncbi:MAG: hypothetical protein Ct9H300mP30_2960 [Methanobacteriota archaeon]|nr:MAG: hypothetical protein Ct9H300mP30_2960 [Euryarchaeota archaeon]